MLFCDFRPLRRLSVCLAIFGLCAAAVPAAAQGQPWQPTGPVYQTDINPGEDLIEKAYRACPAGFRERGRSLVPGTQLQSVQFQCLTGVQVPKLPHVEQIRSETGKPRYRLACATLDRCLPLVIELCPGGTENRKFGPPRSGDGFYYAPNVKVGSRWRKATLYTISCS